MRRFQTFSLRSGSGPALVLATMKHCSSKTFSTPTANVKVEELDVPPPEALKSMDDIIASLEKMASHKDSTSNTTATTAGDVAGADAESAIMARRASGRRTPIGMSRGVRCKKCGKLFRDEALLAAHDLDKHGGATATTATTAATATHASPTSVPPPVSPTTTTANTKESQQEHQTTATITTSSPADFAVDKEIELDALKKKIAQLEEQLALNAVAHSTPYPSVPKECLETLAELHPTSLPSPSDDPIPRGYVNEVTLFGTVEGNIMCGFRQGESFCTLVVRVNTTVRPPIDDASTSDEDATLPPVTAESETFVVECLGTVWPRFVTQNVQPGCIVSVCGRLALRPQFNPAEASYTYHAFVEVQEPCGCVDIVHSGAGLDEPRKPK